MSAAYLTPADLAVRWNVHKRSVQRLCESGKLRGFRIGGQWRISEAAITAYEMANVAASDEPVPTPIEVARPAAAAPTGATYSPVVKGPVPWRSEVIG